MIFILCILFSSSLFSCLTIFDSNSGNQYKLVKFTAGPNSDDLNIKISTRNKTVLYDGKVPVELKLKAGGFFHRKVYIVELSKDNAEPLVVKLNPDVAWGAYLLGDGLLTLTVMGGLGLVIDPMTGAIYKWGQPKVISGNGTAYGGMLVSSDRVIINMHYYLVDPSEDKSQDNRNL